MNKKSGLRIVEGQTGQRPDQYRVLLSATLITTTTERPIKLRNLSATSAQIEGAGLPPQGTDVLLKRGTLEIFATMAWSEGKRGALHFETALSQDEMLAQLSPPAPAAQPTDREDYRRPGFNAANLSDEDRRTAADWVTPVGRLAYRD